MTGKVALYARVSTANQLLVTQIKKLHDKAKAEGWNCDIEQIQEIPPDIDADDDHDWSDYFSGEDLYAEQVSSINERPRFEEVMSSLNEYDKLAVTEIDRFARSIRDFTERINDLEDAGVEFEAVDQPINTEDEVYGDFMMKMLALFAELERKMIRRRLEEGFEKAKEEGRVGRPEALSETEKDQIEVLYSEKSYSWESLQEEFDVSRSTIYRVLKGRGAIDA